MGLVFYNVIVRRTMSSGARDGPKLTTDSTRLARGLCETASMNTKTGIVCAIAGTLVLGILSGVGILSGREPNFSGEWKMNAGRSSFAPLPAPDAMVRKVSHEGSHLKIATTQSGQQQDITTELSYTTDGKVCENTIRGKTVTGTAKWDGSNLVIDSQREVQGMQIGQRETWTLSGDGRTLTIVNHVQTPQAGFDITIVFEKMR